MISFKGRFVNPCSFLFTGSYIFPEFKFVEEPVDVIVNKDQAAILNCHAKASNGNPVLVRWKRDGQFIHFPDFNDRRYLYIINPCLHFILIKNQISQLYLIHKFNHHHPHFYYLFLVSISTSIQPPFSLFLSFYSFWVQDPHGR